MARDTFSSNWKTYLSWEGATSRDDAIFSGERHFWREGLLQGLKSPWTHTEVVEIRNADWPEIFFWPINEEV